MVTKIAKIGISIIGVLLGLGICSLLNLISVVRNSLEGWPGIIITIGFSLLFGIIFYFISPRIIKTINKLISTIEVELQKVPTNDIILGTIGLIIGLII